MSESSSRSQRVEVIVNDRMQREYRYERVAPEGQDFDPAFIPELTPVEMLALGVFCGRYVTDCRGEFPESWFANARLATGAPDCSLNFFSVQAGKPLTYWRAKGRRPAPDRSLASLRPACRASSQALRARRSVLPPAPAAGLAAVGLRQPHDLTGYWHRPAARIPTPRRPPGHFGFPCGCCSGCCAPGRSSAFSLGPPRIMLPMSGMPAITIALARKRTRAVHSGFHTTFGSVGRGG